MQTNFAEIDDSFPRLIVCQPGVPTGDGSLFVRRLIYGAGYRDLCIDDPTWKQIVSAVSDLDSRHDVLLEGPASYPYLVVCGGKADKYVVAFGESSAVYYSLNPRCQSQERVPISIGGQMTEYEADLCVDGEQAMQAIWAFAEQGTRLASVKWIGETLSRDL